MKIVLLLLSLLLLSLNFVPYHPIPRVYQRLSGEEYDEGLGHLDDMRKLIYHIDSVAENKNILTNSLDYAELSEKIIKERFMWGYSFYSLRENWVAALAGKLIWKDLAGIVEPDYILKHGYALCSQQGLVIAEVFKRKHIIYRTCGFAFLDEKGRRGPGHFAIEAKFGHSWYYIDPTLEPHASKEVRNQDNWICDKKHFSSFFVDSNYIYSISENILLGEPNAPVAKNNKAFQRIAWYLSRTLFLLPLFLVGWLFFKEQKKR